MQVKVYKPTSDKIKVKDLLKEMFSDLKSSRDLAWRLTVRDIKAQYRKSYLGIFWAFVTPLMSAAVWVFLNSSGAIQLEETGIPYPAYVFTGTMIWAILMESMNSPLKQTNGARSIITKINIPKESLLLAGFYKIIFNTSIKVLILLIALVAFGIYPTFQLLFLPVALLGVIFIGMTIGTIMTPTRMLFSDISRIQPLAMQFLMYLSPVVYSVSEPGLLKTIVGINPFTALVTTVRSALTGMPFEYLTYFFVLIGITSIVFFFAWFFYRFSIPIIIERNS